MWHILQNVNDANTNFGDAADNVGANLIAASFGVPALLRVKPKNVDCDLNLVQQEIDAYEKIEEGCDGSDALSNYLRRKNAAR